MPAWPILKLTLFVAGTGAVLFISRTALSDPRSHGFYRLFAWESILFLFLLNMDHWFEHPLRPFQIISWLLLAASLFLIIDGTRRLRTRGTPDSSRGGSSLYDFERTTSLVTSGVFRYVRHPMYSSLLFLAWGVFFKSVSWIGATLAVLATLLLTLTAKIEEEENERYFGRVYREYMQRTRMFIPFVF